MFEKAWSILNRTGIAINEKKASEIYILCLVKIMGTDGVEVPKEIIPENGSYEYVISQIKK